MGFVLGERRRGHLCRLWMHWLCKTCGCMSKYMAWECFSTFEYTPWRDVPKVLPNTTMNSFG